MYSYTTNRSRFGVLKMAIAIILTAISTFAITRFWPLFSVASAEDKVSDDVSRLSFSSDASNFNSSPFILSTPEIIASSMDSVVGISILEANGDSILDPNSSQKWGYRYGRYCF